LKHEGDERKLVTFFYFHAPSMTPGVGHWLSMRKSNGWQAKLQIIRLAV
jgi:hypothetical protein